jgi:hypothetical protein
VSAKAEIGWRRPGPDGTRIDVYARHVGGRWLFYTQTRRNEPWLPLLEPALEDWLALLDAVERRVRRRLLRPEEVNRVRQRIRELFPDPTP